MAKTDPNKLLEIYKSLGLIFEENVFAFLAAKTQPRLSILIVLDIRIACFSVLLGLFFVVVFVLPFSDQTSNRKNGRRGTFWSYFVVTLVTELK